MRFGIIANVHRPGAAEAIREVLTWGKEQGHEIILCEELRPLVPDHAPVVSRRELAERAEAIVSMGGDGTLLASARAVGPAQTPLLGINLGSLGFLTQQQVEQLVPALNAVAAGEYHIDRRMLLEASVEGRDPLPERWALNDVVLDNGSISRVIDITLLANGEEVVTYKADGLIIATPTGSTAYSLAVGGPIVHPSVEAMIAAPISAFALTTRPMVFAPTDTLEMAVATHGGEAILTLDGQVMIPLEDQDRVTIRRAPFYVHLIQLKENSYYRLLRKKLNWGVPPSP